MAERRQIEYTGCVQGVGFRATTRSVAGRFKVSGYVLNLPDGGVRVVAEGEPGELDGFFAAVRRRMGRYIQGTSEFKLPATGEFEGFDVRYFGS
ncbi:MAG: acylphosphatase [Planctomycetia bacterium]|nr:acylphosphatase [Planctomycetia bacterium]